MQGKYANEKRAEIDEEIQLLHLRIRELSTTRNTLAPIASLHSELLVNIFALSQFHKYGDGDEEQFDGKIMLVITSICREWRSTALEHPLLWAEINHTNRRWAVECFERSKGANLKIDTTALGWPSSLFTALFAEMTRVQWLALNGHPASYSQHWPEPQPTLRTLKLLGYPISDHFCSLKLPALRVLELQSCRFYSAFPSLSSLTRLEVSKPSDLGMRNLLNGLRSAINIVSLELSGFPDQGPSSNWNEAGLPHVSLLTLSTLTIRASSIFFAALLIGHLSIPSRAHAFIDCEKISRVEHEVFVDLFKDIARWDCHLLGMSVREDVYLSRVRMECRQMDTSGWVEGGGCLDLRVIFESSLYHSIRLLQRLPMENLERVLIRARSASDGVSSVWRDIFAPLPNLKLVEGIRHASSAFMDVFVSIHVDMLEQDADQAAPTPLLPFPALEEIKLKEYRHPNIAAICKVLRMRNSYGARLKSLEISPHNFHEVDIETLKAFVDNVLISG